jgi:arabinan endo-1,5-alpha-L-arabinosidase
LGLLFFVSISLTLSLKNFNNPIIPAKNSPDPGAIFHGGFYYVVTTAGQSDASKFPIHRSKDLQSWELVSYVFPKDHLPKWANPSSSFWAPELHVVNGKFNVYYTGREHASGILCIGVGTAEQITGPYKDRGAPLIKNNTVEILMQL